MKAVVFHDIGDIRIDDVAEPTIQAPDDAIIKVTHSAICGTDLHMVRGTLTGMQPGTILGHEAVGVVEEVGSRVRNINIGDRVVVPSTIACGHCAYCRDGYHAQCDTAHPDGPLGGTAFFGGPKGAGGFNGMQAEYARIPYANAGLVKLPKEVDDYDALMVSDIVPTGFFGADMAGIRPSMTVAVFGCGPVGLFAIVGAQHMGAGRVLAIDNRQSRLDMAKAQGAEVINFDYEDPVEVVRELTGGIGVDRVIDAVGVDAEAARSGPAADEARTKADRHARELREVAPDAAAPRSKEEADEQAREGTDNESDTPPDTAWKPGNAPSQALDWAVESVAKAGLVSIIGVYPPTQTAFPIGLAMQRNLSLRMGNCNHRRYIPELIDRVRNGTLHPQNVLSQTEPIMNALEAYEAFDRRDMGWIKVALDMDQEPAEESDSESGSDNDSDTDEVSESDEDSDS